VISGLGDAPRSAVAFIRELVAAWRQGTREGQWAALGVLAALCGLLLGISFVSPITVPVSIFSIPLVLGSGMLRFRPLAALLVAAGFCVAIALTLTSRQTSWVYQQTVNLGILLAVGGVVLFVASRDLSGLPGRMGQSMLMELTERLRVQGVIPPLPAGWLADSALRSAGGAKFAGDFLVAHVDDSGEMLELVLVDVSGKGVGAGTKSLQFAGALGGLIGTMPPRELFQAANDFLLRQHWDFEFATAVNLRMNLRAGEFLITSAGHPPALRWNRVWSTWDLDKARGMALGIARNPQFAQSKGVLEPGEALMVYTDGVVETRDRDIDNGIDALRELAATAVRGGWEGIAQRIVTGIRHDDDDRAVLVLHRARI
jgi:hypothetical protein